MASGCESALAAPGAVCGSHNPHGFLFARAAATFALRSCCNTDIPVNRSQGTTSLWSDASAQSAQWQDNRVRDAISALGEAAGLSDDEHGSARSVHG